MKKKITQWFIGLTVSIWGLCNCSLGVGVVANFLNMVKTTGKESIGHFLVFVFCLLAFIFLPYVMFKIVADGVEDKFK